MYLSIFIYNFIFIFRYLDKKIIFYLIVFLLTDNCTPSIHTNFVASMLIITIRKSASANLNKMINRFKFQLKISIHFTKENKELQR